MASPIGTPTYLGHNTHNASSSALAITLSGAIPTDALAFCGITIARSDNTTPVAPSSVSGGGVTWALETTLDYDVSGTNRAALFVYRAYASAPSGTTVTITPGYTCTMAAGVCYVTGTKSGNNGGDALIQEVTGTAGAIGSGTALGTCAMATLTDTTNNGFLMFTAAGFGSGTRTITPDASPAMTEVTSFDFQAGTGSLFTVIEASYILATATANPSLAATASAGGTDASGAVAYEIAAATGPTITTQPTAQTARINGDTTNTATFTATATGTGTVSATAEIETSVGSGTYTTLANGSGATWTGLTASGSGSATVTPVGTFTAKTQSGKKIRLKFSDTNGDTYSDAVVLTVLDGPVLSASTATTNGSGVASVTMTSDDALTANGELLLVTMSDANGNVIARTTVRPA